MYIFHFCLLKDGACCECTKQWELVRCCTWEERQKNCLLALKENQSTYSFENLTMLPSLRSKSRSTIPQQMVDSSVPSEVLEMWQMSQLCLLLLLIYPHEHPYLLQPLLVLSLRNVPVAMSQSCWSPHSPQDLFYALSLLLPISFGSQAWLHNTKDSVHKPSFLSGSQWGEDTSQSL